MENENEFLNSKLDQLVSEFDSIKASLFFDKYSSAYFVEIKPLDKFNDVTLKKARLKILTEFYELNFNSVLNFIDEESILEIKEFDCVFMGSRYFDFSSILKYNNFDKKSLNNEVKLKEENVLADSIFTDYNYAIAA